jgi:hypothetical protein
MRTNKAALILAAAGLAACATTRSPTAAQILEADAAAVAQCKFVGHISGYSLLAGPGGKKVGRENAKTEALEQAAKLGATHVVWRAVSTGDGTNADGDAYLCPTSHAAP